MFENVILFSNMKMEVNMKKNKTKILAFSMAENVSK